MAGRATDQMLPVSSLVERGVGGRAPLPSADVPCYVLLVKVSTTVLPTFFMSSYLMCNETHVGLLDCNEIHVGLLDV